MPTTQTSEEAPAVNERTALLSTNSTSYNKKHNDDTSDDEATDIDPNDFDLLLSGSEASKFKLMTFPWNQSNY